MDERRLGHRYTVEDVKGSLLFNAEARILNMSVTGLAIETSSSLRVGRGHTVKLTHAGSTLRLSGTVVWCRLCATRRLAAGDVVPVYEAGLRFDGVLNDQADAVVAFLRASAVVALETRIFGRFKVEVDSAATLASTYELAVRQISASGMLIETELDPEEGAVFDVEVRFDSDTFRARGRVARVFPSAESEDLRLLAIAFSEVSPEDRYVLDRFIGDLVH